VKYDCGLTKEQPQDWPSYRAVFRGWSPGEDLTELVVLAHTVGIPRQYLVGVFSWTALWRRRFTEVITNPSAEVMDMAAENAATIVAGDGWRMLAALSDYKGQVPLWSSLDLQMDQRFDREMAEELEVPTCRVTSWRRSKVFDPLTGEKLVGEVGSFRKVGSFLNKAEKTGQFLI